MAMTFLWMRMASDGFALETLENSTQMDASRSLVSTPQICAHVIQVQVAKAFLIQKEE